MELYSGKEWSLPEYGKTQKCSVCVWEDRWSVFVWNGSTLYIHNALSGELMEKRKTRDSIVKVVYCSFDGYGTCIAALLHDGCQIWDNGGDCYLVSLPCRMSTLFPIRNGLLFERIDDTQLTNTSFNLTSTLHSFPNYFSLSSPLSLPKPISQSTTESSILNQSVLDLSRILNVSEMELLNSRLDDSSEDDISIIASLSPWNLTVIYDKVQKSHYIFQLVSHLDDHGLNADALLETALTTKPSFSDSFIQLLNIPEYGAVFRFAIESETPFDHVILTAGMYKSQKLFFYCKQGDHIRCFSFPRSCLTMAGEMGETVELTEVSEMEGTIMDLCSNLDCVPEGTVLKNSVLIMTNKGPLLLLDGIVFPITISLHDCKFRNGRYSCHSHFLLEMVHSSIHIFPAELSMDSLLLRFLSLVSHPLSSFPAGELTEEMRRAYGELAGEAWLAGNETVVERMAGKSGGKELWEELEELVEKEEFGELAGKEDGGNDVCWMAGEWLDGKSEVYGDYHIHGHDDQWDGHDDQWDGHRQNDVYCDDGRCDSQSEDYQHGLCNDHDHDDHHNDGNNNDNRNDANHNDHYNDYNGNSDNHNDDNNHHNDNNDSNHHFHHFHHFHPNLSPLFPLLFPANLPSRQPPPPPPPSPLLQEIKRLFTFPPNFPSHSQKRPCQSPSFVRRPHYQHPRGNQTSNPHSVARHTRSLASSTIR